MRTLWTPRWLLAHAAAVFLIVAFLGLCWWQVSRAANGNALSFGYAIEWPAFAGFVVYVWVKEARQAARAARSPAPPEQTVGEGAGVTPTDGDEPVPVATVPRRRRVRNETAYDDSGDSELAAYNRYLAWLNANPQASPSEYTG